MRGSTTWLASIVACFVRLTISLQAIWAQDIGGHPEWALPDVLDNAPPFERELTVQMPRLSGPDVIALQSRLIKLGYDSLGDADGYYGPLTAHAFERFAAFNGVTWRGVIDEQGWFALFTERRQRNRELRTLGDRRLVYALGFWDIFDNATGSSTKSDGLDPAERVPGYLHCDRDTVREVTARMRWFWASGPYSPNDFAPSIAFDLNRPFARGDSGSCSRPVFSYNESSPFVEYRSIADISELPPALQITVGNWLEEQGIIAPVVVSQGFSAQLGLHDNAFLLVISSNRGNRDDPSADGYTAVVAAVRESGRWRVSLVTGQLFDVDVEQTHPTGFGGFQYRLTNLIDADGNGVADVVMRYLGGAWGNGEVMYLLGEYGQPIGYILGFGD